MRTTLICALLILFGSACEDSHAPDAVDRLECVTCHAREFAQRHASAEDHEHCYECHGTVGFNPISNQRHPAFPIDDPETHAGFDCFQCHIEGEPRRFVNDHEFSCIGCHAHSPGLTSPHHGGVDDYTYAAQSCADCHCFPSRDDCGEVRGEGREER